MPIEGDRRIAKVSDSFADFLIYWIEDDRRKYYELRMDVIRDEGNRFGSIT